MKVIVLIRENRWQSDTLHQIMKALFRATENLRQMGIEYHYAVSSQA